VILLVQLGVTVVMTTTAHLPSKRVAVIRGQKGVTLLPIALLNLRPARLQWLPVERGSVAGDVSQPANTDTIEVADSDCLLQLRKTVDQLSSVVQAQQATITKHTN